MLPINSRLAPIFTRVQLIWLQKARKLGAESQPTYKYVDFHGHVMGTSWDFHGCAFLRDLSLHPFFGGGPPILICFLADFELVVLLYFRFFCHLL